MADDPQPITLMVKFDDGSQMSLLDLLKQADSIPPDARVRLSDGRTESAAEYQAYVHQKVNEALDGFTKEMSATVEDLSSLGDELWSQSGEIGSILWDLQSRMAGIDAAIGNDNLGNAFKKSFHDHYSAMTETNFPFLVQSLAQVADDLHTSSSWLLATEEATLQGFGRTVADPRPRRGGGRGRNRYL